MKSVDGFDLSLGTTGWFIVTDMDGCSLPVRTEVTLSNIRSGMIWFSYENCYSECQRQNKIKNCQRLN